MTVSDVHPRRIQQQRGRYVSYAAASGQDEKEASRQAVYGFNVREVIQQVVSSKGAYAGHQLREFRKLDAAESKEKRLHLWFSTT
jgi:hypothetical protein